MRVPVVNGGANSGWGSDRERSVKSRLPRRQVPEGRPVGSFTNYVSAQATVDLLNDRDESLVSNPIIVGVDLMQVGHVVDRLTWPGVLGDGTLYGLWTGLFSGLILRLSQEGWMSPLVAGLGTGAIFGIVLAAIPYTMQNGKRDFPTTAETVAHRYGVLCSSRNTKRARDLLAQRALGGNRRWVAASAVVK